MSDSENAGNNWLTKLADKASPSSLRGLGMAAGQLTMTRVYGDLANDLEVIADAVLLTGAGICVIYAIFGMFRGK